MGDVLHRRELKNKLKEERKVAEELFNERERNRHEALEHARSEHEAKEEERLAAAEGEGAEGEAKPEGEATTTQKKKRREFDEKIFLRKWDAENAKVDVPPPVVDDIDNDYDLLADDLNQ